MKNLIIIIAFISSAAYGQNSEVTNSLLKKFTLDEVNSMNQELVEFNSYCIKNAFYFIDKPVGKSDIINYSGGRKIQNINTFEFFDTELNMDDNKLSYYNVLSTNKILVVKSKTQILKELNNEK
jgi:hypothetical protein